MRWEQRVLAEKTKLQQELLAEADAEGYFARHGRDSLRQTILEAQHEEKLNHLKHYHNPWDEFHRQYTRDTEAGGNTYTREADRLAVLVLGHKRSGKESGGKLLVSADKFLKRYEIDWERYPDLTLLELAVYIYAVLTKQVYWSDYAQDKEKQWRFNYVTDKPKGYKQKDVTHREQQEHLQKQHGRIRHTWKGMSRK